MAKKVQNHTELKVFQMAFDSAMKIFEMSKSFPKEERFSLVDQIRRASRSVCGQIAEGWRRRRYRAAFLNKMNEAEGEAAETQAWLQFAVKCKYIEPEMGREVYATYNKILGILVGMINHADTWVLPSPK